MNCNFKYTTVGLGLLLLSTFWIVGSDARGLNGGISCAACTILFGMADQLAEIHNETLMAASLRICNVLPSSTSSYCAKALHTLEPLLIDPEFLKFFTPDVICYGIGTCYVERGGSACHLFPQPLSHFHRSVNNVKKQVRQLKRVAAIDFCSLPGIRELCDLFDTHWINMQPAVDVDGDMFSLLAHARGYNWRGRDCRDYDASAYPGRKSTAGDRDADLDCNGVWGSDPATGDSYEGRLCEDSGARGVVYLGDSVGAHFHFPEAWMNPGLITYEATHNYTTHLLDELDWPQLGFATGYTNTTEPLLVTGITDSIYLRLRARNRCNHRDYQNVCRNGASSYDLVGYVGNVARHRATDKPALVLYGAFGNDVCNSYKNTEANMTTTGHFRKNVLAVLEHLNATLPSGSHVLLIELIDGGRIFPTMGDRFHPLGQLRKDVRYSDVYSWFTCMEIGPCVGWMNSNATLRKLTTERARKLNVVLYNIATTEKYSAFTLGYVRNPMEQVFNNWTQQGKPHLWQLIDPIDSLHPSQLAQPLIAEALWKDILDNYPDALGDENPHNARIQELFGDQGGH